MRILRNTLLALSILVAISACSDSSGANRALKQAGYTNIKTTGYAWFECGQSDSECTGFSATSPSGMEVTGAVGGSWMGCKGHTIRVN